MNKLLIVTGLSILMAACGSKKENETVLSHDAVEVATEHEHHGHGVEIVGIAQEGEPASGKITIVGLNGGESSTYDYSTSNPDKIAAWIAGDTVTIFMEHHHHGDHHHDSITAIKIGNHACIGHEHEHSIDCGHQH